MAYTTIDDPTAYFQAKTYTGNAGTNAITNDGNSDLSPNWIWFKMRSNADNHTLFDTVRGVYKRIFSNLTQAQGTENTSLTAFGTNGFTLGSDGLANANSKTFVAWQWKESATAGFDIVAHTGNSSNHTVAHSLAAVPEMMISKNLSATSQWQIYTKAVGNTKALQLGGTGGPDTSSTYYNNTSPTSSVFTVGTDTGTNGNGNDMIVYLFRSVKGFSSVGNTYVGNGNANGQFIYLGFKPAFVMVKRTGSGSGSWWMRDNKIAPFNVASNVLVANSDGAQTDGVGQMDFVSNGFKLRDTTDASNGSGSTYFYMAFAEQSIVSSTAVPATAR